MIQGISGSMEPTIKGMAMTQMYVKLIEPTCRITMSSVKIPPAKDINVAMSRLRALLKKAGLTNAPQALHALGFIDLTLSHAENVSFLQFGHTLFPLKNNRT